jgi:uncharacterized protein
MPSVRLLPAANRTWTPWKNGGGLQCDVVASPAGAGQEAFGWRVAMARIERDGPFSDFPQVDRTLMIIGGNGIRLEVDGFAPARLTKTSTPYVFPGDQPTAAALLEGDRSTVPVLALNVMARRGAIHTRVGRIGAATPVAVPEGATMALVWTQWRRADDVGCL